MAMIVMSAPEPNPYRALFHDYIRNGVAQLWTHVRDATPLVPEPQREQAWHLLSYAFNVEPIWPLTRKLLLALAPKMEQAGFREEWLPYLEQGLVLADQYGDHATAAACQWHMGYLQRLLSRFDAATTWLRAAAQNYAAQGDKLGQARALNQLAYVDYLQRRYQAAGDKVAQAQGLLTADDPEQAMSFFVQGMIAIDHEDWQTAEVCHRHSLRLRKAEGDQRKVAWSLQNLGYALRGQQRFAAAISCYDEASLILDSLHDPYNWTTVQMNLGLAYLHSQQPQAALPYFTQAETMYRRFHDRLNLAKLYTNLGLNYLALDEWPEAEQAFSASVKIYRALGDESAALNATDGLAMTYLAQHHYEKAVTLLEEALTALQLISGAPNYQYLHESLTNHLQAARTALRQ